MGLTQSMAQGVAQVAPTILMGLMNKYGGGNADAQTVLPEQAVLRSLMASG